ncbi:DUF4845 domain-containing protein [Thermomonas brevis]|uniref:DUF4845 domain-containing protein n=1 Tax=Thermomonas brevis TaxID=215691 RepID=A0A7G9QVK3_9GAMM|nr:DUF4845 domain-containing protein [Thermomonas brevis]QNN47378.1 DUF4845 domain-containing protein [Thermomonas brevis]
MKQTQRGMTMLGFLMVLCLGIFFAFCAMKIVPMYIEYYSVKKMLATISKNPEAANGSKEKIRDLFRRGLEIDYVKVIKPDMLKIESTDGGMKMIVDYERRENLMANLDVVGKFHAEQVMARGAGGY